MKLIMQRLAAPNDRNGNPKRVWVFYNLEGHVVETVDEGYKGNHCQRQKIKEGIEVIDLGTISTSHKEYKIFVNWEVEE